MIQDSSATGLRRRQAGQGRRRSARERTARSLSGCTVTKESAISATNSGCPKLVAKSAAAGARKVSARVPLVERYSGALAISK